MEWMFLPLKRYAQFSGRARRKEFWMWILFVVIATVVLSVLDRVLGLGGAARPAVPGQFGAGAQVRGGVLTGLFSLAILLPNFAVQVRRLHDTNHRGWWLLLPIGPYLLGLGCILAGVFGQPGLLAVGVVLMGVGLICAILLLVWLCMDGTRGANRFGEDPKGAADLGAVFR